jgi:5'-methylthioadenosine phosphorylase
MNMPPIELAVIGGSGLYDMADLTALEEIALDTPFGAPSDKITLGTLHGRRLAFLPRHGRGHFLSPSDVPYRANIFALKQLGVKYIVSVSACGSLREHIAPGDIVIPDQLVDWTKGQRERSFFGRGLVAHVSVADPFNAELSQALATAVQTAGGTVHQGGAFITIEGPRFSTRGESNLYRQWGLSIIGMTTSPEAFLAAEAEIAYACMAHVTDYDVWHDSAEPVTVEMVIQTMIHNTELAKKGLNELVRTMASWEGHFAVHDRVRDAMITSKQRIDPDLATKLAPIVGKYL